jgi:hypothetical protein
MHFGRAKSTLARIIRHVGSQIQMEQDFAGTPMVRRHVSLLMHGIKRIGAQRFYFAAVVDVGLRATVASSAAASSARVALQENAAWAPYTW